MGNRSTWKGPFIEPQILNKINKIIHKKKNSIKTWSRKSTIIPNFVGLKLLIHNGKKFIPITIQEKMIGKKIGEFALTRNFKGHNKNKEIMNKKI